MSKKIYTESDLFQSILEKVMCFLEPYVNLNELEQRAINCKYSLTNNTQNQVDVAGKIKNVTLGPNCGFTVVDHIWDGRKIKLGDVNCLVTTNCFSYNKVRQVAFHEIMHVLSTKRKLHENRRLEVKSGVYQIDTMYVDRKLEVTNQLELLNEGFTELISKFIYDKLYTDNYTVKENLGHVIYYNAYHRAYFMLAFTLLNYLEKHVEDFLDIYFNNNVEKLKWILHDEKGIMLDSLNRRIIESKKLTTRAAIDGYNYYISYLNKIDPLRNGDVIRQFSI